MCRSVLVFVEEVSELEEKIHPPLRPEPTIREDEEPPEIQLPTSQDSLNIISDLHTFQDDDHDNMIQRMVGRSHIKQTICYTIVKKSSFCERYHAYLSKHFHIFRTF